MRCGLLHEHARAACITTKKNKHRCQPSQLAPAGEFHGGSFGVYGTPPLALKPASRRGIIAQPFGSEKR
jgi:hypothetical protein